MISAWTIYWVMQLDSISNVITGIAIAIGCAIVASAIFSPLIMLEDEISDVVKPVMAKLFKFGIPLLFVMSVVIAFLPSSKTMAAMLIIPPIANSETVHGEAKELYELAKQAMVDLVQTEEEAVE